MKVFEKIENFVLNIFYIVAIILSSILILKVLFEVVI